MLPVRAVTTAEEEARAALSAGEGQRAVELAEAALANARSENCTPARLADMLELNGNALLSVSEYPRAMRCFIESLDLWRQLDKPEKVVSCLHSIGQIDTHVGNFAESAAAYSEALTTAAKLGAAARAPLLQRMGMLYSRLGDFDRAQQFHEEAAAHHQLVGDKAAHASALNSIGTLHLRAAEAHKDKDAAAAEQALLRAQEYFEKAATIAGDTVDRHLQGLIAGNIGSVFARLGRIDDALSLMHVQLDIVQSAGDRYNESLCLANIGEATRLSGKPLAAVTFLERSLSIAEQLSSTARQRRAHEELSRSFEELGDFERALFHFKRLDHFKDAAHSEQYESRTRDLQVQVAVNEVRLQAESYRAERDRLSRLNVRLRDQAYRDPLTLLANRRSLDESLTEVYARTVKDQTYLAIALADIDHFKLINDRFSHATGDLVLQRVSALFAKVLRGNDLVARYGGEEFAFVLVGLELERALMACERVRIAVEKYSWNEIHPDLMVTVSIGVTVDVTLGSGVAMLEMADRKLYESKRAGRNRISH
jgi:diguanylate cyclase (GGDEF)-like protein